MIDFLTVAGYVLLVLYGAWLFADIAAEWLAERIKHD
jgi:hypothetical protein